MNNNLIYFDRMVSYLLTRFKNNNANIVFYNDGKIKIQKFNFSTYAKKDKIIDIKFGYMINNNPMKLKTHYSVYNKQMLERYI